MDITSLITSCPDGKPQASGSHNHILPRIYTFPLKGAASQVLKACHRNSCFRAWVSKITQPLRHYACSLHPAVPSLIRAVTFSLLENLLLASLATHSHLVGICLTLIPMSPTALMTCWCFHVPSCLPPTSNCNGRRCVLFVFVSLALFTVDGT